MSLQIFFQLVVFFVPALQRVQALLQHLHRAAVAVPCHTARSPASRDATRAHIDESKMPLHLATASREFVLSSSAAKPGQSQAHNGRGADASRLVGADDARSTTSSDESFSQNTRHQTARCSACTLLLACLSAAHLDPGARACASRRSKRAAQHGPSRAAASRATSALLRDTAVSTIWAKETEVGHHL